MKLDLGKAALKVCRSPGPRLRHDLRARRETFACGMPVIRPFLWSALLGLFGRGEMSIRQPLARAASDHYRIDHYVLGTPAYLWDGQFNCLAGRLWSHLSGSVTRVHAHALKEKLQFPDFRAPVYSFMLRGRRR